jgi:hypothetical protein
MDEGLDAMCLALWSGWWSIDRTGAGERPETRAARRAWAIGTEDGPEYVVLVYDLETAGRLRLDAGGVRRPRRRAAREQLEADQPLTHQATARMHFPAQSGVPHDYDGPQAAYRVADDALAPAVRAGHVVYVDTGAAPTEGQLVAVSLGSRRYAVRRAGDSGRGRVVGPVRQIGWAPDQERPGA